MSKGTDELSAHSAQARTAWTKLASRLTELKVPAAHDAWKQHRELGVALDNVDKDVVLILRENATGPITTLPVVPPVVTPPAVPTPRATVATLTAARGVNWSCFEDGRRHVAPTADYLRRVGQIRLPIAWDYNAAEIHAVLDVADSVPGAVIWVECHSYGRVGNARTSNGVTTGPLATPQQIAEQAVRMFKEFGRHASYGCWLDNEPAQTGPQWELCSQAAVTALRAAGQTGVIAVSGAQASNVGSWPSNHPKPWITDSVKGCIVYVGHHYPEGQEERVGQTFAQLDAYGRSRGFAGYAEFIKAWFSWGLLGNPAWKDAKIVIGETAFTQPEHLALYLALAKARGVGVFLWADGVWNDNYGFKVGEDDLKILDSARS